MEKKINEANVKNYLYLHQGLKLNFSVTNDDEKRKFYELLTEASKDLKAELKIK